MSALVVILGLSIVVWLLTNHGVREIFSTSPSSSLNRTTVLAIVVRRAICRYGPVTLKARQFPLIDLLICLIIVVVVVVLVSHVEW